MNPQDARDRFLASHKLLLDQSTSLEKFEQIRTLIKGINPKIDKVLAQCSKRLSQVEHLQKGEVIELTAENLPENTEEEKKRKKAILYFIKSWKTLVSEVERVKRELESDQQVRTSNQQTFTRILSGAKGPFGLLTIAAIIAAGGLVLVKGRPSQKQPPSTPASIIIPSPAPSPTLATSPSPKESPTQKTKIKVIIYNDQQIPLDQLEVKTGPECTDSPREAPHYHAKNSQFVKATDGTIIPDPGACGFGKVRDTQIIEVE